MLTIAPSTRSAVTKVNLQDDTVRIAHNQHRPHLEKLLAALVRGRPSKDRLFAHSLELFRAKCKTHAAIARVPKLNPHQLRHGGASHDSLLGRSLTHIQNRGRWASQNCLLRYTKHGRYVRQLHTLTTEQVRKAKLLRTTLPLRIVDFLNKRSQCSIRKRLCTKTKS